MVKAIGSNVAQYVRVKRFVDALGKRMIEALEPKLIDAGRRLSSVHFAGLDGRTRRFRWHIDSN